MQTIHFITTTSEHFRLDFLADRPIPWETSYVRNGELVEGTSSTDCEIVRLAYLGMLSNEGILLGDELLQRISEQIEDFRRSLGK